MGTRLSNVGSGAHRPEVGRIPRTLVGVAAVTECLEVGEVISTAMPPRHDMVDLNGPLVCDDAAQLAAEACVLEHLVAQRARDVPQGQLSVRVEALAALLDVRFDGLLTETEKGDPFPRGKLGNVRGKAEFVAFILLRMREATAATMSCGSGKVSGAAPPLGFTY
jgi:hypothetical protein